MKLEQQTSRIRLDELLVRRGLFATRSRARDAVERGTVRVAGVVVTKPGAGTSEDAAVDVDGGFVHAYFIGALLEGAG